MLMPKRVKYRRQQRGRMKGKATRGNFVSNGDFGLMATEPCWITANQIEAAPTFWNLIKKPCALISRFWRWQTKN